MLSMVSVGGKAASDGKVSLLESVLPQWFIPRFSG